MPAATLVQSGGRKFQPPLWTKSGRCHRQPVLSDGEAIYKLVEKLDDKINVLEIKLIHIGTVVENVFKVLDGKYANGRAPRPDQDGTNDHRS